MQSELLKIADEIKILKDMVKDMIMNLQTMKKLGSRFLRYLSLCKRIAGIVTVTIFFAEIFSITSFAMTDPIYSYTVENGSINLFSVTFPDEAEELNIPSELEGKPVEYVDESFAMWQTGRYRYVIGHMGNVNLKRVIFPASIKEMPNNMIEHFKKYYWKTPLDIIVTPDTMIFETQIDYNAAGLDRYGRYSFRKPKITVPEISLAEAGKKMDLYVDGVKFEDCVLYNGMTYISFDQFKETEGMSFLPLLEYAKPIMYDSLVIKYDFQVQCNEKYLDTKGEYCEKEFAEYVETSKRIVANFYTGELIIMEYYMDKDADSTNSNGEICGGEVKIIEVPVYPDYLPLRAAYESLGFDVKWDEETNTVYVTSP